VLRERRSRSCGGIALLLSPGRRCSTACNPTYRATICP